jgi:protein associated with RNAse G/E
LADAFEVDPSTVYRSLGHYTLIYDDKLDSFFSNEFDDEFEEHRRSMNYPQDVVDAVQRGKRELLYMIFQRRGPFEADYVERWYERFLQYR